MQLIQIIWTPKQIKLNQREINQIAQDSVLYLFQFSFIFQPFLRQHVFNIVFGLVWINVPILCVCHWEQLQPLLRMELLYCHQVLLFLLDQQRLILRIQRILQIVWNYREQVTVSVCVVCLRNFLLILTIHICPHTDCVFHCLVWSRQWQQVGEDW